MFIRLMLSIVLLIAFHTAHAEPIKNLENHAAVVADTQRNINNETGKLRSMVDYIDERDDINPLAYMPKHSWNKLVFKKNTRYKLGRAVVKYKRSNKKHPIERISASKRLLSLI